MESTTVQFTQEAYQRQQDGSLRSAGEVVPLVIELIKPRSVVDVGCGVGTWLSVFKNRGITDILGIDGDYVDPEWLHISRESFTPRNLTQPLKLDRQFDLAVSIEVAEHLPPPSAGQFVQSLTHLAPVVLFSAAVPNQCGRDHLNEQWPDYWAALFRKQGYVAVDYLRPRLWNNRNIEWWYRQNMILYVRESRLESFPELKEHVTASPSALVHPELYLQHCWAADQTNWSLRQAWSVFSSIARRFLLRKLPVSSATLGARSPATENLDSPRTDSHGEPSRS